MNLIWLVYVIAVACAGMMVVFWILWQRAKDKYKSNDLAADTYMTQRDHYKNKCEEIIAAYDRYKEATDAMLALNDPAVIKKFRTDYTRALNKLPADIRPTEFADMWKEYKS